LEEWARETTKSKTTHQAKTTPNTNQRTEAANQQFHNKEIHIINLKPSKISHLSISIKPRKIIIELK
jgi:hypothetical protein